MKILITKASRLITFLFEPANVFLSYVFMVVLGLFGSSFLNGLSVYTILFTVCIVHFIVTNDKEIMP